MQGIRRLSAFLVSYARDTKTEASFPEDTRKGEKSGKRKTASRANTVEGAVCPLCGKPVTENAKAFGCAAWKDGCRFTLWKNMLEKGGGPTLTAKLVQMLLEKKTLRGSTGVIALSDGRITFTPNEIGIPTVSTSIEYIKK